MWNEIKTNDDIKLLMDATGQFGDMSTAEAKYSSCSVNWPEKTPQQYFSTLNVIFRSSDIDEPYNNDIEIEFQEIERMNFNKKTALLHTANTDACLFIHEGLIYWVAGWSENPSIDDIKNSDVTWLSCKAAKWRVLDS